MFFPISVLGNSLDFSPMTEVAFKELLTEALRQYRESVSISRGIALPASDDNGADDHSIVGAVTSATQADGSMQTPSPDFLKNRAGRRSRENKISGSASKNPTSARGRSAKAGKGASGAAAGVASQASVNSARTWSATRKSGSTAPGEGFSDLLELENENQSLRKRLAEKLSAENAILRAKLDRD